MKPTTTHPLKQIKIRQWIHQYLLPLKIQRINYKSMSSYQLKHYCEKMVGFYVSNEDMKWGLEQEGFLYTPHQLNWLCNISSKVWRIFSCYDQNRDY